ncbi:hypothetical protein [Micavibrio aeruginosavorus]|uniref:hypothetical protein n=1 Tax=Micavibrio aeruginosavorus TaxID=349221 RepID=UPI003F4AD922
MKWDFLKGSRWPRLLRSDPQEGQKALPAPRFDTSTLRNVFTGAAYGRKFRSALYTNTNMPEGNTEFLRAVADAPDVWRIVREVTNSNGVESRIVAENVSFNEAVEKVTAYEMTALNMSLLPLEDESYDADRDGVEFFCRREGYVIDKDGYVHKTDDGDLITPGRFDPETMRKMKSFVGDVREGRVVLRNIWRDGALSDFLRRDKDGRDWARAQVQVNVLKYLARCLFNARTALYLERMTLNKGERESIGSVKLFKRATAFMSFTWKDDFIEQGVKKSKDKKLSVCGHFMSDGVEIVDGIRSDHPLVKRAAKLTRDIYIFDLVRRCKDRVRANGNNVHNVDLSAWMGRIRDMMHSNGQSSEDIKRVQGCALDPAPITKLPYEFEHEFNELVALHAALSNNAEKNLGMDIEDLGPYQTNRMMPPRKPRTPSF